MAERITPAERSRVMAKVRGKNTGPELIVRRAAHRLGYRFRLHRRDLPGAPDLVFPKLRAVIFVHGCFWHQHDCSRGRRTPASNAEYWTKKLARNEARDACAIEALTTAGWQPLVLWECELRDTKVLDAKLKAFLGANATADSLPRGVPDEGS